MNRYIYFYYACVCNNGYVPVLFTLSLSTPPLSHVCVVCGGLCFCVSPLLYPCFSCSSPSCNDDSLVVHILTKH